MNNKQKHDQLVEKLNHLEEEINSQKVEILNVMREQESSFFDVETAFDILCKHMNGLKQYETDINEYIDKINAVNTKIAEIAIEIGRYLNIGTNKQNNNQSGIPRVRPIKNDIAEVSTKECGVSANFP